MRLYLFLLITTLTVQYTFAQNSTNSTQIKNPIPKVDHAEPLNIDLMRDLGARKGEAEINFGFGIASYRNHFELYGFAEYEWAVADRLGMEVEIPFSFNKSTGDKPNISIPNNKIEGLKLATQYTFLVNEKRRLSMAVAYVHEFELNSFKQLGNKGNVLTGMKMNPVFVAAKNINQFNTMLYTGPVIEHEYKSGEVEVGATINASMMYVIPHSKNFIGIENNMDIDQEGFHYYVRPQLKLTLQHNLMIGIVTGVPLTKNEPNKLDVMTRIIWEP